MLRFEKEREATGPSSIRTTKLPFISLMVERFCNAAKRNGSDKVIQEALSLLMRLSGYHKSLVHKCTKCIPYVLLRLRRYDDLCAAASVLLNDYREPMTEEQQAIALSGNFPFSSQQGLHLKAIDYRGELSNEALVADMNNGGAILHFLVAMFAMKLQLENEYVSFSSGMNVFLATSHGESLQQVSSVLKEMACGSKQFQETQRSQVMALMNAIEAKNSFVFPAVYDVQFGNGELFLNESRVFEGTYAAKAYKVVEEFRHYLIAGTPGTRESIKHSYDKLRDSGDYCHYFLCSDE